MKNRFLLSIICFPLLAAMALSFNAKAPAETHAEERKINRTPRAETVTMVDDTTDLLKTLDTDTEENYLPTSRQWTGVPSIIKSGKNIFAAWQTGGPREPDTHNYIVVAVSTDGGNSWVDPFMLVDPGESVMLTVPMFYYNKTGQLFLLFYWRNVGVHAVPLYNTDGDLSDMYYGEPFFIGSANSAFNKPTILKDGRIAFVSGGKDTWMFSSDNDGLNFTKTAAIASVSGEAARQYAESTLVELDDGRLWALRRLENATNGGIESAYSEDGGKSWSTFNSELPPEIKGPGSRFNMQRLKSGALLFITNAEGMSMSRYKMTAYLSVDDGKTFPYALLLDKWLTSYPDFYQDSDGTIYVIFDKDRYGEGGMRMCAFTEEDVKAGEWVSAKAKRGIVITKVDYGYSDIAEVKNAFKPKINVALGTDVSEIIGALPTDITVVDSYGESHTLSGSYRVAGYNKDKEGTYTATFITSLPTKLIDSFDVLSFKITVGEKTPNSGSGSGGGCGAVTADCPTAIAAELLTLLCLFTGMKIYSENKRRNIL